MTDRDKAFAIIVLDEELATRTQVRDALVRQKQEG